MMKVDFIFEDGVVVISGDEAGDKHCMKSGGGHSGALIMVG